MTDTHQKLMNEAYDRWQKEGDLGGLNYNEFISRLDKPHRNAVLLGNLNYQVQNGGFRQWVGNGYATEAHQILDLLKKIGTETALKVSNMIEQLMPFLEEGLTSRGFCGSYWVEEETEETCCECDGTGEMEEEYEEDDEIFERTERCPYCGGSGYVSGEREPSFEGTSLAESLDNQYYDLDKQFMQEVESFLNGEMLVKATSKPEAPKKKPRVKLIGKDGNAFFILGTVSSALKKNGQKDLAKAFREEATSGDYNHLLQTAMKYVDVY